MPVTTTLVQAVSEIIEESISCPCGWGPTLLEPVSSGCSPVPLMVMLDRLGGPESVVVKGKK